MVQPGFLLQYNFSPKGLIQQLRGQNFAIFDLLLRGQFFIP